MKQKLTAEGRARLRDQLCAPPRFISPDEELLRGLMEGKAVGFWEATAMEFSDAPQSAVPALLEEGISELAPDPGWETGCAVLMVTAGQSSAADLSLGLIEDLAAKAMEGFGAENFTFGVGFSELDYGVLRLVLAASYSPVRAPEELTRMTLGTLTLLVGGTRLEREQLLGDFVPFDDYVRELEEAAAGGKTAEFDARWRELPRLAVSEAQLIDGRERAAIPFSDLLLCRFHKDLPTVLGMQYLPACFGKWFPLDRMRRDTPARGEID